MLRVRLGRINMMQTNGANFSRAEASTLFPSIATIILQDIVNDFLDLRKEFSHDISIILQLDISAQVSRFKKGIPINDHDNVSGHFG